MARLEESLIAFSEPSRQGRTSAATRARARWSVPHAHRVVELRTRSESPDAQLVALMQEGNAYAFELFYDRHSAAAFGLARRMVDDRALAERVVQEAFTSVWRSCHLYRSERGTVGTWVLGVTQLCAIDALRQRQVDRRSPAATKLAAPHGQPDPAPGSAGPEDGDVRRARRAIEALAEEERRTIELAYFAGLTHAEIAEDLVEPQASVKARMRLGLEKLGAAFDPGKGMA